MSQITDAKPIDLLDEKPETIISKNSKIKATIKFNKLLRIEGSVIGSIEAPLEAGLILCEGGHFSGDLIGLGQAYIDGKIEGNITVRSLQLGPNAIITGNINCCDLEVCGHSVIIGNINVSPDIKIPAPGTNL